MDPQSLHRDLLMLVGAGDWAGVERAARFWLTHQKFYVPHLFLIQALVATGRDEEADEQFADLLSYKFNLQDRIRAFPGLEKRYAARFKEHYVLNSMRSELSFEAQEFHEVRRWNMPHRIPDEAAFIGNATALLDAALGHLGDPRPDAFRSVVTFGSCFAVNLAKMLNAKGRSAHCLLIEESINSTFANKLMLEVVAGSMDTPARRAMFDACGPAFFDEARQRLAACSHLVLTVGVAPAFFDVDSGEFVFARRYGELLREKKISMRTTTVAHNMANLREILRLLHHLAPRSHKTVTVSPVPLAATAELPSVVLADCVSKSTLRAAVHEALSEHPEVLYFPAFEIVRWLSPYGTPNVFGASDGNSRHVSDWVVSFIVGEFDRRCIGTQ